MRRSRCCCQQLQVYSILGSVFYVLEITLSVQNTHLHKYQFLMIKQIQCLHIKNLHPHQQMLQKITTPLDYNPIHSTPKQPFTTTTGKCVGFIAIIILSYIFISKCITVFDRQIIYINSNIYESNNYLTRDNRSLDITSAIQAINVGHSNETGTYNVKMKDQYKHGINGTVIIFSRAAMKVQKARLVDCSTQARFASYTYCMPDNVVLQVSFADKKTFIQIEPCNRSISQQCVKPSGTYTVLIALKNTIFNPFDRTYQNITLQETIYLSYQYEFGQAPNIAFPIDQVNIESDQSVFPLSFLADVRTNRTYQLDPKNAQAPDRGYDTFSIGFGLSKNMKRFERRFKKIDVALAEVLGISAVIGIVCRLLFSGYNHWVYERYVISKEIEKQSMVEQEQRDKYSRSNSGIIKYIKWQFSKKQDKQQQQQLFKQASDHQNRMMEVMNKKLAKMSEEFNNINHKLLMEIEELRKQVQKCSGVEKKEVGMGERQIGKNKHEFNINEEDSSSMMQSVSSTKRNGSLHERLL